MRELGKVLWMCLDSYGMTMLGEWWYTACFFFILEYISLGPHVISLCLFILKKLWQLKSRDITLPTKVCLVKTMVFPVVVHRCESWTIKKAEHWRIDAFKLWRLLRIPWTARRSNQLILKEINPEYSLEGLMLKLDTPDVKSCLFRKDPDAGEDGRQQKGMIEDEMVGWHHWLSGHEFKQDLGDGEGQWSLACHSPWSCRVGHDWATDQQQGHHEDTFILGHFSLAASEAAAVKGGTKSLVEISVSEIHATKICPVPLTLTNTNCFYERCFSKWNSNEVWEVEGLAVCYTFKYFSSVNSFYPQYSYGKGGKLFSLYKCRSRVFRKLNNLFKVS